MNRLLSLAASLLLVGSTGLAWAQDSTPNPGVTPSGAHSGRVRNPQVKEILERIKIQKARIDGGVKNGKLTAEEAAALNGKLKAIGEEMKADFQQNKESGQKGLTEEQIQALKKELEVNSTAIHDIKQDTVAAATPVNP